MHSISRENGFRVPGALHEHMRGFKAPWSIAGGWALDLFLGEVTRPHCDIEFLIFREDETALQRHLSGFALRQIASGKEERWPDGQSIDGSIHQLRARRCDFDFDIFLAEGDQYHWYYRRDRRISLPRGKVGMVLRSGLPILVPEVVLLFKAKHRLPKDEADFKRVYPQLSSEPREWLMHGIELAHPDCLWQQDLQDHASR
jgi:hypothetical protein